MLAHAWRSRQSNPEKKRRAERIELEQKDLLDYWSALHTDPAAEVWMITAESPEFWELWAPGTVRFDDPDAGPLEEETPYARHPAGEGSVLEGFDPARDDNPKEPPTLAEIRTWAQPWVEGVAGREVLDMTHGWTRPWGFGRNSTYAIFIECAPPVAAQSEPRPTQAIPAALPATGRCGAKLDYCTGDGERVLVEENGRRIFRYLCPSCQVEREFDTSR